MKILILFFLIIVFVGGIFFTLLTDLNNKIFIYYSKPKLNFWEFKSIDTMKYSRDLSREKLHDPDFDVIIDIQIKNIAATGATHVAIATPYDEEFVPMLRRWVSAARKYNLKVWFRGNWAGWEKWFGYSEISKEAHIQKTKNFILANSDLFENGDVFSACPECENGVLGNPRITGNVSEYREFIITEYRATKAAFEEISKDVRSNYFSMNADVARLIMDKETTRALDGIVTIDHYVKTPEKLTEDIKDIAAKSGGRIVLGEFGAPIPDIHGEMSPDEQAQWIRKSLNLLTKTNAVIGVNYWSNVGSSTQIWNHKAVARPAVEVLTQFYKPNVAYGIIQDELRNPIENAKIIHPNRVVFSDKDGYFELPYVKDFGSTFQVQATGFIDQEVSVNRNDSQLGIILVKQNESIKFKLLEFLKKIIES